MTKREAYKRVFGKESINIEGIDWDSEVDDAFEMELEVIKQMVEKMQNEKAILMIDMPNKCEECDVRRSCKKAYYLLDKKPSNCPLRPMPKKFEKEVHTPNNRERENMLSYVAGYNKCLDEILGEDNETTT